MPIDFSAVMDWSAIPDPSEYPTVIPEGTYHCVCSNVEGKVTKNNDPSWILTLKVLTGEYAGSEITDRLTFLETRDAQGNPIPNHVKAYSRIKYVLEHLGGVNPKAVRLDNVQLIGRQALVDVGVEKKPGIKDPTKIYENNVVKYLGYHVPPNFQYLVGDGIPPIPGAAAAAPPPPAVTPAPAPYQPPVASAPAAAAVPPPSAVPASVPAVAASTAPTLKF